jgi:hypothetical protein
VAVHQKNLPYTWEWASDKAKRAFEGRYTLKQQRQITRKLDELCRHAQGDVAKLKGLPGL